MSTVDVNDNRNGNSHTSVIARARSKTRYIQQQYERCVSIVQVQGFRA